MNPFVHLLVNISRPVAWQIVIATAVSLAFFIFVGLLYTFASGRRQADDGPSLSSSPLHSVPAEASLEFGEGKDMRLVLVETYFDLTRKLAQRHSIPIERGDTEREILYKIAERDVGSSNEILTRIYSLYEILRFSQRATTNEDLKQAASLAKELSRKVSLR